MRAMILAAGLGERMRPLSNTMPKPLLEVRGQPIIVHLLRALAKSGFKEIVMNLHYLANEIKDFLGDGSCYGVKIDYSYEYKLLDTGGGIVNALPLLGEDPFLVVSVDIYTDYVFHSLAKIPERSAHLVLVNNPAYHPNGDYALKDNLVSLSDHQKFTYANIGVFKFDFFANAPEGAFPLSTLLNTAIEKTISYR